MKGSWKNHTEWYCNRHLPASVLPAEMEKCWYAHCPCVRPPLELRPEMVEEVIKVVAPQRPAATESAPEVHASPLRSPRPSVFVGAKPCAWKDCHRTARANSMYCSRKCSNKNARWRHKQRKTEAA